MLRAPFPGPWPPAARLAAALLRAGHVAVPCLLLSSAACWAPSKIERLDETPRAARVPGTGDFTWNADRGWVQPEKGSWGAPEHVRAEAFRAFQHGQYADALAGFLALQELRESRPSEVPVSVVGNDLGFHIAECYFHLGNYEEALEYYRRTYRQDFPAQNLVEQALQRVFTIGMAYLKEEIPCNLWGIASYHCPEYGIEILASPSDGLITEFPQFVYANTVLIEMATYYFNSKQYPEAVPIYDRVASETESEWADLAEFQAAESTFQQIRGVDYDQRIMEDAKRRFDNYIESYPRGSHVEEARRRIDEISEMEGSKELKIAEFYLRESQPVACEHYLERVIRNYPNSAAAREAREILKQLERLRENL